MPRQVTALFLALAACVSDAGPLSLPDAGKLTGEEGGPCYRDGTCKAGLVCVATNQCAKPDASMSDASPSDGATDAPGCALTVPGAISFWPGESTKDMVGMNDLTWPNPSFIPAKIKNGFALTGASPSPEVVAPSGFFMLGAFTIELWLKIAATNAPNAQRVVSMDDGMQSATTFWSIEVAPNTSSLVFQVGVGPADSVSVDVQQGTFIHVAFVLQNGALSAYRDGMFRNSATGPSFLPSTGMQVLRLGSGGTFHGVVDELAVYGRGLSAQELAQIAGAASGACRTK